MSVNDLESIDLLIYEFAQKWLVSAKAFGEQAGIMDAIRTRIMG